MSAFGRIALDDEGSRESRDSFREAQLEIAKVNQALAEQEERELKALDDAIVGTDHVELRRLREGIEEDLWSVGQDPNGARNPRESPP